MKTIDVKAVTPGDCTIAVGDKLTVAVDRNNRICWFRRPETSIHYQEISVEILAFSTSFPSNLPIAISCGPCWDCRRISFNL